ncbi:MAG TPA: glycosyltransferase [Pyrinomonadaceae bacterium]|nr:glycosyltransferase [Pyrinomonadaceae bacterium]
MAINTAKSVAKSTLYICYFGLREPLVQTQVIPYLREIIKDDIDVSLLTFEPDLGSKWTQGQLDSAREELAGKGIRWFTLPYHKRPSAIATIYDVLVGTHTVRKLISKENVDILHARVHVPGLMAVLARKFSSRKPKILFDIRGFFPEEYTDAGIWPENGKLFRAVKRVEKWIMNEADGFVVLTENAREILFPQSKETGFDHIGRPVEVIPCCVDLPERFPETVMATRAEMRKTLGIGDRRVLTHLGALGGLYLSEEIADLLEAARIVDPSTFALFLTQSDPETIVPLLLARGFAENDFFVGRVAPREVGKYLSAADAGLSFVKATYSTASRSPTKIPEYLACGLPVIANRGVGDVDSLILEEGVGVLVDGFSRESYFKALEDLSGLGEIGAKCRRVAAARFDLETVGGPRYRRMYKRLLRNIDAAEAISLS